MEQKKNRAYSIQIMIAALNEELGIGHTITELYEHLGNQQILLIDGNSYDRTVEIAKDSGLTIKEARLAKKREYDEAFKIENKKF